MERFLGRYSPYIYALFRIVFGLMFVMHGTQKFFNVPASKNGPMELAGLMLVGAAIETVCGLMILTGFFASIGAFIASGMMATAYFMVHHPMSWFPIQSGGELAVAYCFAFLYIASRGSGVLSVDSLIRGSGGSVET